MKKAKTIAVVNQKGGVGKTTTTFNLGACLAEQDKKVLLIDLDQQGNLTYCMGHEVPDEVENTIAHMMLNDISDELYEASDYINTYSLNENVDYICCNVMMSTVEVNLVNAMSREQILKNILSEIAKEYDYILLDCGPSLGMITINALVAADSVLIPLQAEKFASLGLELLLKNIIRVKRRLNPSLEIEGILFVAVPERHNEAKKTIREVSEKFKDMVRVYDYNIPRLTEVTKAIREQKPMIYSNTNESVVGKIYQQLAKEVIANE